MMEEVTKDIELIECPECHSISMPVGNKYCSLRCWEKAFNRQKEEFLA